MKRFIGALPAVALATLFLAAGARAAATPTATTGGVTAITSHSALLHGQINPQGAVTDYTFNYGPTPSYGAATVARSAGTGKRSVAVTDEITDLLPGTTYHYQVTAVSAAGSATGADGTFTTAGAAPSAAVTGPAAAVRKQAATLTATVTPGGAVTPYQFQYGTTTAYGLESYGAPPLAPGSAATPVSATLAGLAPARLFHYRIVSYHGGLPTYGADATFFTQPIHPPSARMTTRTTPSADTRSPYRFTTTGVLHGGSYIPAAQRCSGTVGIRYANGRRQLAFVVADVGSDCRFSGAVSFRRTRGRGSVPVRVSVDYRGNGYLHSESRVDHIHAGRA